MLERISPSRMVAGREATATNPKEGTMFQNTFTTDSMVKIVDAERLREEGRRRALRLARSNTASSSTRWTRALNWMAGGGAKSPTSATGGSAGQELGATPDPTGSVTEAAAECAPVSQRA